LNRLGLFLAIGLLTASCGKGVVPGTTFEHPLRSFTGVILPVDALAQALQAGDGGTHAPLVVTLLWTDPLQRTRDIPAPASSVSSRVDPVTNEVTFDLFRPPPDEALVDIPAPPSPGDTSSNGDVARVAVGEIVMIADGDGDGTFRVSGPRAEILSPDRYLAGSAALLVYVARPFAQPRGSTPLGVLDQPGFSVIGFSCNGRVAMGTLPYGMQPVGLIMHESGVFPEVRLCGRTHSP
jgi:hypothetical protein